MRDILLIARKSEGIALRSGTQRFRQKQFAATPSGFCMGSGLGYSLADIIGEKYIGGVPAWKGIRGGTREIALHRAKSFSLKKPPWTFPRSISPYTISKLTLASRAFRTRRSEGNHSIGSGFPFIKRMPAIESASAAKETSRFVLAITQSRRS